MPTVVEYSPWHKEKTASIISEGNEYFKMNPEATATAAINQ